MCLLCQLTVYLIILKSYCNYLLNNLRAAMYVSYVHICQWKENIYPLFCYQCLIRDLAPPHICFSSSIFICLISIFSRTILNRPATPHNHNHQPLYFAQFLITFLSYKNITRLQPIDIPNSRIVFLKSPAFLSHLNSGQHQMTYRGDFPPFASLTSQL